MKKNIKRFLIKSILLYSINFLVISISFGNGATGGALGGASGLNRVESEIIKILSNIIRFAFSILMLLASAVLIYVGVKYIVGQIKVNGADIHKAIFYLIIGISLLITSFFIPGLLKNFIENSIWIFRIFIQKRHGFLNPCLLIFYFTSIL